MGNKAVHPEPDSPSGAAAVVPKAPGQLRDSDASHKTNASKTSAGSGSDGTPANGPYASMAFPSFPSGWGKSNPSNPRASSVQRGGGPSNAGGGTRSFLSSELNTFTIDWSLSARRVVLDDEPKAMIRFVRFNEQGTLLAYGGMEGKVKIVSTETWDPVVNLQSPDNKQIYFGEFSPDGCWFIFGGLNKKIMVHEIPTDLGMLDPSKEWRQQTVDIGHDLVFASFSPDSTMLAYGGVLEDSGLSLVKVGLWETKFVVNKHQDKPSAKTIAAFCPDGKFLVYATEFGQLLCLERKDHDNVEEQWQQCVEARDISAKVPSLSFSPSGHLVAYAEGDIKIVIARTDTLDSVHEISTQFEVRFVRFSIQGGMLAYGGEDHAITVLAQETWDLIKTFKVPETPLTTDFSCDGQMLAFGGKDKKVTVVLIDEWEVLTTVSPQGIVFDVDFMSTESDIRCVMAEDRCATIFSMGRHGKHMNLLKNVGDRGVRLARFSPDTTMLAYGGKTRTVTVLATSNWEETCNFKIVDDLLCMDFSPDSYFLAFGGRDRKLHVTCPAQGEIVAEIDMQGDVRAMKFSPSEIANAQLAKNRASEFRFKRDSSKEKLSTGQISVWIKDAANLSRDMDLFSSVDAFCVCKMNGQEVCRTQVCNKAGVNPVWNFGPHILTWDGTQGLEFSVYDADVMFDDFAGTVELSGQQISASFTGSLELVNAHGKSAGWLSIRVEFKPDEVEVINVRERPSVASAVARVDDEGTNSVGAEDAVQITTIDATSLSGKKDYWLAIGSGNKKITMVSSTDWTVLGSRDTEYAPNSVAFSPDGKMFVYAGKASSITMLRHEDKTHIVPIQDWNVFQQLPVDSCPEVMRVAFSPRGAYFAFGGRDRKLTIRGTQKAQWKIVKEMELGAEIKALSITDRGLLGVASNTLAIIDVSNSPPSRKDEPMVHELGTYIKSGNREKFEQVVKDFPFLLCKANREGSPACQVCIESQQSEMAAYLLTEKPMLAYVVGPNGKQVSEIAETMVDRVAVEALVAASLRTSQLYSHGVFDLKRLLELPTFADLTTWIFEDLPLIEVDCRVKKAAIGKEMVVTTWYDDPDLGPNGGLWKKYESNQGCAVVAKRTVWPGLGSLRILRALLNHNEPAVFSSPCMEVIVTTLWDNYAKKVFMRRFAYHICYVFVFTLTAWTVTRPDSNDPQAFIIPSMSCAWALLFLMAESKQCRNRGVVAYLKDFWNSVDLVGNTLVLICVIIHFMRCTAVLTLEPNGSNGNYMPWNNFQAFSTLVGFTSLCVYFNVLQYLRGFDKSSALVQMLLVILWDMLPFCAVLAIVVLGFCNYFFLALRFVSDEMFEEESPFLFGTWHSALFETMKIGLFGEMENFMNVLAGSDLQNVNRFVFSLYILITSLVMLNALIAIMGDSYSRVRDDLRANIIMNRAQMVCEHFEVLAPKKLKQIEEDTIWFHVLHPRFGRGHNITKSCSDMVKAVTEAKKREPLLSRSRTQCH